VQAKQSQIREKNACHATAWYRNHVVVQAAWYRSSGKEHPSQ
jgi:hypothetical protein